MTTITETPLEAVNRRIRETRALARREGCENPRRLAELYRLMRERLALERERRG